MLETAIIELKDAMLELAASLRATGLQVEPEVVAKAKPKESTGKDNPDATVSEKPVYQDEKPVSQDEKAALRAEGARVVKEKEDGRALVKDVLDQFGYTNISSVGRKDYESVLSILKSL